MDMISESNQEAQLALAYARKAEAEFQEYLKQCNLDTSKASNSRARAELDSRMAQMHALVSLALK